jgi:hypothetical protein
MSVLAEALARLGAAERLVEDLRGLLVICRIRCERAEKALAEEQRRRDRERRDAGA